ncbi:MAG TPA: hypothetical protein VF006_21645 [Longimicrobium sp.]
MFGLEILDVVIGLMFVYLLLSLLATAVNEYISAVMNLRGKELARGLGRLLDDVDETEALRKAFDGVGAKATSTADKLTEQFYNHPLIRPLATRRGWMFRAFSKEPRLPSYIPARTFAQALLDVLGVQGKDANLATLQQAAGSPPPTSGTPTAPADGQPKPDPKANLVRVLQILKRESPQDVAEYLGDLKALLEKAELPADAKVRLVEGLTASQTQLQKLHDSVEVWFNNSMDRVSGAYKRNVQGWLFIIGLAIAVAANADTIQMWHQLSANEELAKAMADRAAATLPLIDSVVHSTTASADSARDRYLEARARLDSMELRLGWTHAEARRIGLTDADSTFTWRANWLRNAGFWAKLLGLLLTGIALALGAPFWFDLLNKVISIRAAGRSPEEKPKSPQGPAKRAAEETPK